MKSLKQAKRIIVSYLVGKPVKREVLEQACEFLTKEDPVAVQRLRDEMGLEQILVNKCDVFRENVAEFCEMADDDRMREMDDLNQHMKTCLVCYRLFWEIKPKWTVVRKAVKRLTEGIKILVDPVGQLLEKGGPPSLKMQFVAATMGPTPAEVTKAWELEDEEAGCLIRLTVRVQESRNAEVTCELTQTEKELINAGHSQIEVFDVKGQKLYFSGPLLGITAKPVILPLGLWSITIQLGSSDKSCKWEIPFEIEQMKPE